MKIRKRRPRDESNRIAIEATIAISEQASFERTFSSEVQCTEAKVSREQLRMSKDIN